jgi:hypothetical protein
MVKQKEYRQPESQKDRHIHQRTDVYQWRITLFMLKVRSNKAVAWFKTVGLGSWGGRYLHT